MTTHADRRKARIRRSLQLLRGVSAGPGLTGVMVGAGNVSGFHLEAWQHIAGVQMSAVIDLDLDKARQRAAPFGLPAYPSLEDYLAVHPRPDFVDITAPPDAHLALVTEAARYGIHVLCQKPLAPSLEQARQMAAACQEAGVLFSVNENWRWRAWYRQVKDLLAQDAIGRPVYASFFLHGSGWLHYEEKFSGHRFLTWPRVILYDMGTHHLDILRFLFGEMDSVYARMDRLSPMLVGEDRALVVLGRPGFSAVLDMSWTSYAPRGQPDRTTNVLDEFRVEGTRGALQLLPDPVKGDHLLLTTGAGAEEMPVYQGDPHEAYKASYRAAQAHFIDCLRSGSLPETHAGDNLRTLALTLAAYESAERNQVVDVASFLEA